MRNFFRKAGRYLLWVVVALIFFRGLFSIFGGPVAITPANEASNRPVFSQRQEAEAFAVNFAAKYLTYKSGDEEGYIASLEGYHSLPDVSAGFTVPDSGPEQHTTHVIPSRFTALSKDRARIVVSANVITSRSVKGKKGKPDTTQALSNAVQYWTVSVARGENGGLTVYQHPSRVAAPASTTVELRNMERPEATEESDFELLLTNFFPAYFSGESEKLVAYIPTDEHLEAIPADQLEFVSIGDIQQPAGSSGDRRNLTVEVGVANPGEVGETEEIPIASRTMTYEIQVRRVADGRWLVAAINPE